MKRVSPHSLGLLFAAFLALWHALWALLVLGGIAQGLLDFIFRLHMITPPYQVLPFSLKTSLGLVLVTAAIGYLAGMVVGLIWNRLRPDEPTATAG